MNFEEVKALGHLILDVRNKLGLTVLLLEQHMDLVMSVSDHLVALNLGRKIAEGPPELVKQNPDVVAIFPGASDHQPPLG